MGVYKEQAMFSVTSRLKLIAIPTLFLVIFAFIGTLGLLVLNIQKRIQEFSLHRAMGATKSALMRLVILQSLVLTLSASVPGILLSMIVFSFSLTHLLALVVALGSMLLFSLFSACYPAWQNFNISKLKLSNHGYTRKYKQNILYQRSTNPGFGCHQSYGQ